MGVLRVHDFLNSPPRLLTLGCVVCGLLRNCCLIRPHLILKRTDINPFRFAPPRLPFYIASSSSAEIFKKRLKTYLFALFSINFCHSSDLNERHLILRFLICLEQLQNTVRWKITKLRCKTYFSLFIEKLVSEPSAEGLGKKAFQNFVIGVIVLGIYLSGFVKTWLKKF